MGSQRMDKAYRRRSVVGTVFKIGLLVVGLLVLAGVGVRFLLPDAWEKAVGGVQDVLDAPLMDMFETLSTKYVDEADDMDDAEKKRWKERFADMTSALREEKGSVELRKDLKDIFDGIVEEMKDGDLKAAELAPFRKDLDDLLEKIEIWQEKEKE